MQRALHTDLRIRAADANLERPHHLGGQPAGEFPGFAAN